MLTHPQPPLHVSSLRTHLLLFLEMHFLVNSNTMTTTGTSIPNRMATKLDASGMGQEGGQGGDIPFWSLVAILKGLHPTKSLVVAGSPSRRLLPQGLQGLSAAPQEPFVS